jgi:FAD dependent oxidoreductase TIGR03364
MANKKTEVAVIGGGIVGLSQALAAAKSGFSVTVFERNPKAEGASVRNFGMIWPIGLPAGLLHDAAMLTRQLLLEIAPAANAWVRECGSIHLARADDEAAVLEEFAATSQAKEHGRHLLTPDQVIARSPAARREGLKCGLYSPVELAVDPRELIAKLPDYLREQHGVRFEFATTVVGIDAQTLSTADARHWDFEQAIVCGGPDFQTLFPQVFARSGVRRCKLQMMRTYPQPDGWLMGPHVAGGATLVHYSSFAACPSLPKVRARLLAESPELDRHAIHVMAAQNGLGEITIGDSHEYDENNTPFDNPEIDAIILDHLNRMLDLPDPRIGQRWHGCYPRHRTIAQYVHCPLESVRIVLNSNGLGMTLSLGLAELARRGEIDPAESVLSSGATYSAVMAQV